MISAILYTSNTGSTERYAKMLGEKTGLAVHELKSSTVPLGAEIVYMGWVMASGIQGYKKAVQKYQVKAVCGVCMGATGSQIPEFRQRNAIAESTPVFTLQGGFDLKKLHGIYRFMMKTMFRIVGKSLANKADRTSDEDDMLDMMLHGGDRVSEDNLKDLLAWLDEQA